MLLSVDLTVRRPGPPMARIRQTSSEDDIEGFVTEVMQSLGGI